MNKKCKQKTYNDKRTHPESDTWIDIPAYANMTASQSVAASFAKSFLFYQDDGRIFRHHYTESIDPFEVVPEDLIDWPIVG